MPASLDLTKLLPPRYRDKTLDTLIKNLFNRHLSKIDAVPLFGHVGSNLELQPGDVQIAERDLERQINQLSPIVYAKHGTETILNSWPDLLQKLTLLGVDYKSLSDWFKTNSYNFVPPMDLDKFCNFNQYFWIGKWIRNFPSLPYGELGLPALSNVTPVFTASNSNYLPEYFVIKRSETSLGVPVAPQPSMTTWSDWALANLWVHRDDVIKFLNDHPGTVSFSQLTQAVRPIIEYSDLLKLNKFQTSLGVPADSGTLVTQRKLRVSQLPLFDLYHSNGEHTTQTSAIFYYKESSQYPEDPVLFRRVSVDSNEDFTFQHSLINEDTKELLFYKIYDGSSYDLSTIWKRGPEVAVKYSKYDTSGTLINQDKFTNFKNYYWIGVDSTPTPSYNQTLLPEYSVIEIGGTSDWSIFNKWVHVGQLNRNDLSKYVQAERPIIEFNLDLESELINVKTEINQLPKFRLYRFNDTTNQYDVIPALSEPNTNDSYMEGRLFARLSDLPDAEQSILTTPEILANAFKFNDEYYIQGLYSGRFVPERDGVVYGYLAREVSYSGASDGLITLINTSPTSIPQLLKLTAISPTQFQILGSISGDIGIVTIDTPFTADGVSFTVTSGSIPFSTGDKFVIEVKSYVYVKENLFVNLSGIFRTLTSPSSILSEKQSNVIVDADPNSLNGIWETPPQIKWNVQNETRESIGQGDLYYHLTSIIEAQPDLVGGATGNNNWRKITPDLGLGGVIKQYDGNVALLISMLIQQGITPGTLIEFARQSYERLFSEIHQFVLDQIPTMLSNCEFTPPQNGNSIDPLVIAKFKEHFASVSSVVNTSASKVDDYISTPFYDTTSQIQNLVVTLPYLNLEPLSLPQKTLDLELNLNMIVHHDGHRSKLPETSIDSLKSIVTKKFVREPGQSTSGLISGNIPPTNPKPYKGQFWFKTTANELYFFNVVSDTNERPTTPIIGTFTYDRQNNILYEYTGTWIPASINAAWTLVNLDLIEANLILAIETELYRNCPPPSTSSVVSLQLDSHYNTYQKQEFEKFGIVYGVTDVYSTAYNAADPFTWNYSSAVISGASQAFASWQEIYRDVYGTPRPDLQPWISSGYTTLSDFLIDYDIFAGNPPGTTTTFDYTTDWPTIEAFVHSRLILLGRPNKLSVDSTTGNLLTPFGNTVDNLINTVPTGISNRFSYGDLAPIETYWKKTLNYLYSKQQSYFRINPLKWVQNTWGIKYETVGNYNLQSLLRNKESPSDFAFHGDDLNSVPSLSLFNTTILTTPTSDIVYEVKLVSRLNGLFKVTGTNITNPIFMDGTYSDSTISLIVDMNTLRGFFWGDTYKLIVHSDGTKTETISSTGKIVAEGFNQLYVQYARFYGQNISTSINKTLFSDWTTKLSYRFGGFVNTDSLTIDVNSLPLVGTSFNTYVKENKFYDSSWIDTLRIQLVQRGSSSRVLNHDVPIIGPGGTPGEDWIFRIDTYNSARPTISWFTYNLSGDSQSFIALDGKRTLYPWKRYTEVNGVQTFNAPFLITGMQNVINFIFGYSDKRASEGWVINNQEDPVIDNSTGKAINYQLLIEQFIAQQFSGAEAGTAFICNPFSRKVWFNAPRGVVSNLYDFVGLEQETVPTILDQNRKHILPTDVRVFRDDSLTELVFDQPAFTIHLLVSEYEHVVLFENYSIDTLLYDSFLGQIVGDMFFEGEKQSTFTGRIDFGGHYLLGDQMKRNIESSIESVLGLYSTTSNKPTNIEQNHSRSLLGFQHKQYFTDRSTSDQTEFRFWQGMIANKGTNLSIDAYVNSPKFNGAKLDEYWAYKVAEYGDSRPVVKSELRNQPEDCLSERTNYLFLEEDELSLIEALKTNGGYDVPNHDVLPYDFFSLYTLDQVLSMEAFDARGSVLISPIDENRWHDYFDLRSLQYFEADVIAEFLLVPTSIHICYPIMDARGKLVRADCFELIDVATQEVYYEIGNYIPATSGPFEYADPKFKRISTSTIQILDASLLGRQFKVRAYAPSISRYSPNVLFNFQTNTTAVNDIIWWDPARGSHHPEAYREIDYEQPADPATYNVAISSFNNANVARQKPWGERDVGKIWWDTYEMDWQFYSDTKYYTDSQERLARWGAIADFSNVKIYEWVKSSMTPQDYEKASTTEGNSSVDGKVAIKNTIKRERTWSQRVVAWKMSNNPATVDRKFIAYNPSSLQLSINTNGYGKAILKQGSLADSKLTIGTKLTATRYASPAAKVAETVTNVFGLAHITSAPFTVIGSSSIYDGGPVFVTNPSISLSLDVDDRVISFNADTLGQYVLTNELDPVSTKRFLVLTHVSSQRNQKIQIHDVPILAGTLDSYKFEEFGITLFYSTTFDRSTSSEAARITTVAPLLGNSGHSIVLRSGVEIFSPIAFNDGTTTYTNLPGNDLPSNTLGWVTWIDPSINPIDEEIPPYNKYEPIFGEWVNVAPFLNDLSNDIKIRMADPWIGFEKENFNSYRSSWGSWKQDVNKNIDKLYCITPTFTHTDFFKLNFTLIGNTLSNNEILSRTSVYINNVLLSNTKWTIEVNQDNGFPMIVVNEDSIQNGNRVHVQVKRYIPTSVDLQFNPDVEDLDPMKTTQWKFDYPYVVEQKRNMLGGLGVNNYYFWVTGKTTPAKDKKMPTIKIAELIRDHDDVYAVPQVYKFFNQIDARPNRYGLLSIKNLGRYVRVEDTYKLRLTKNPTLRDDDLNSRLKNKHIEWQLLRQYQPTKIPQQLWELLTNTLTGQTALGDSLPFQPLSNYDERHNTSVRYGFLVEQQVLTDPDIAKATVKYTILNTKVDKYVNGELVLDYISYSGFDINQIDSYLSTTESIKQFMSDLWRNAKAKQINEIFFAVLEDAAANNLELSDFFKTSFISLSSIRTVV